MPSIARSNGGRNRRRALGKNMTTTLRGVWAKLRNKRYRQQFVAARVKRGIPFQLRALIKKRKLSQVELAERAGLTQGAVSRALNPSYGNLTLRTIIRIAAGFDVAFIGTFVPFSELVREYEGLSEETAGDIASFTDEDSAMSQANEALEPQTVEAIRQQLELLHVEQQQAFSVSRIMLNEVVGVLTETPRAKPYQLQLPPMPIEAPLPVPDHLRGTSAAIGGRDELRSVLNGQSAA